MRFQFWLALSLALAVGCGLLPLGSSIVVRPGFTLRVVDDDTSLPLYDVKVTVTTLYGEADTVGRWDYFTDDYGMIAVPSLSLSRYSAKMLRRTVGSYRTIAEIDAEGYQFFSFRITASRHLVRLSNEFPVARVLGMSFVS